MDKLNRMLFKLKELNNSRLFERLYVLVVVFITSLFWVLGEAKLVPSYLGLILLVILGGTSLILFNNFKYFIPCSIGLIMANPEGYKSNEFPYSIFICGVSMLIILVIYTFINRNKITLKNKDKSFYALIYFAIFSFIPLLYHNLIDSSILTLIFVYFSYVLYLGLYIFYLANMDSSSWSIVKLTIKSIALIASIQCIFKVLFLHLGEPDTPILSFWYYIGWGLCNEAGIMMCFSLPFLFMDLKHCKKFYNYIIFGFELILILVGMLLTTSRGTYLFGGILLTILSVFSLIKFKNRKWIFVSLVTSVFIFFLVIQCIVGIKEFINSITKEVFYDGMDSNGRLELYDAAVRLMGSSPLTFLFGNGWVAEKVIVETQEGFQMGYAVYHSTFFETACCYGLFGVFAMVYHFCEKYKQLGKLEIDERILLLIGYIVVDGYGLIDNTYNYYYYMIPLVIIMAGLDAYNRKEVHNY